MCEKPRTRPRTPHELTKKCPTKTSKTWYFQDSMAPVRPGLVGSNCLNFGNLSKPALYAEINGACDSRVHRLMISHGKDLPLHLISCIAFIVVLPELSRSWSPARPSENLASLSPPLILLFMRHCARVHLAFYLVLSSNAHFCFRKKVTKYFVSCRVKLHRLPRKTRPQIKSMQKKYI